MITIITTIIIEKNTSPRRNERPPPSSPSSDLNTSPFSDHPSSFIPCDQTQRIRGRERNKPTHQRTIIPHVISSFDPIPSINTTLSSFPS